MITLLHPSRSRPQMAYEAREQWRKTASGPFQHVLSIDKDDPKLKQYQAWPFSNTHCIVTGDNRSLVDATNRAAKLAKGDVIIVMSDDMKAPEGWDEQINQAYRETGKKNHPWALLVHDSYQKTLETMTLPVVNKALYKRLGFIYHPEYFSLFADNDITEICRRLKCLHQAPEIVFEHCHYTNGKNPIDSTYERENSKQAWAEGEKLFNARQKNNFGI